MEQLLGNLGKHKHYFAGLRLNPSIDMTNI